jgi:hypothetical protein
MSLEFSALIGIFGAAISHLFHYLVLRLDAGRSTENISSVKNLDIRSSVRIILTLGLFFSFLVAFFIDSDNKLYQNTLCHITTGIVFWWFGTRPIK